jgi:hypothetical protein
VKTTLPTDSTARKSFGLARYADDYFPAAFAGIARHSFVAGAKHTGGEPMHKRWLSNDHRDCIRRHLLDLADMEAALKRLHPGAPTQCREKLVRDILAEVDALAWRACALSQIAHETHGGAPLAPAAVLEDPREVPPTQADTGAPSFSARDWPAAGGWKELDVEEMLKRSGVPLLFGHDPAAPRSDPTNVTFTLPAGVRLTDAQIAHMRQAAEDAIGLFKMEGKAGATWHITRGPGVKPEDAALEPFYARERGAAGAGPGLQDDAPPAAPGWKLHIAVGKKHRAARKAMKAKAGMRRVYNRRERALIKAGKLAEAKASWGRRVLKNTARVLDNGGKRRRKIR